MAIGVGPIKQAFVRALRDISALKVAVTSDGFHEGGALPGSKLPYVVYNLDSVWRKRQFGTEGMIDATVSCWVVSRDQVEAHNLDQLILDGLEDVQLDFSDIDSVTGNEPSTLLCHRLRDMSLVEIDEAGTKIYRAGGTYQIWLDRI